VNIVFFILGDSKAPEISMPTEHTVPSS